MPVPTIVPLAHIVKPPSFSQRQEDFEPQEPLPISKSKSEKRTKQSGSGSGSGVKYTPSFVLQRANFAGNGLLSHIEGTVCHSSWKKQKVLQLQIQEYHFPVSKPNPKRSHTHENSIRAINDRESLAIRRMIRKEDKATLPFAKQL